MSIEIERLTNIIEAALLAFGQPLSVDRLMSLFSEEEQVGRQDIREALQQLQRSCDGRSVELVEVGSGFRYQARKDYANWVSKLWEEKPPRYSRALLETLVLVAYRQPITRAEIEDIRGVSVSTHIMKTLQERDWVRVVGHKDVPGKPALYATTKAFLDYFNLKSLDELPSLMEIRDLDKISAEIDRQDTEISAAQIQASADALELIDGEDVERLLPDGDADHGDGIEDSTEESVAARADESLEDGYEESYDESLNKTAVVDAVSEKATESTEIGQSLEEVADFGSQENNYVATEGGESELVQAGFGEVGDDMVTTAAGDEASAIDSSELRENVEAVSQEFSGESESGFAEFSDEAAYESDSVASAGASVDEYDYDDNNDNDETDSAQVNTLEGKYREIKNPETIDVPSDEKSESAEEPRFSTADYGLRTEKHKAQERDESEFEEDEHEHHPDRLSAAEPNT